VLPVFPKCCWIEKHQISFMNNKPVGALAWYYEMKRQESFYVWEEGKSGQ